MSEQAYELILVEKSDGVGLITLNRPQALNALNMQVMFEVTGALLSLDLDDEIGCVVITGSQKAFAAGADVKEMQNLEFSDAFLGDIFAGWEAMGAIRKPIIAAVSGYALGGGCELAMMCDFIIAAENAQFGQPEITLGIIPGIGGTQRLTRAVGKAKAMEMCLTGRRIDAVEASPPRAAGSAAFEAAIFAAPIDRRSRNTPSACEMPKPQFAGQMRHRTAGLCWTVASVGLPRPKRRCERQKTAEQCAGGQAHEVNSVYASGSALTQAAPQCSENLGSENLGALPS